MNKQTQLQEKKREAFKRFSKMGAAGLAVLSMSAFTDISAQPLPMKIKPDSVNKQNLPAANMLADTLITIDAENLFIDEQDTINRYGESGGYTRYSVYTNNYCNYYNYSNYSNNNPYSNTYSNAGYSNNYSNSNYSNGYANYSNAYVNGYINGL